MKYVILVAEENKLSFGQALKDILCSVQCAKGKLNTHFGEF